MNSWERLVLAILATWRITHLLASEDGPADLIVRFRRLLGQSVAGKLLDCFNCLSLWVAAATALFVSAKPLDWLSVWLAVSGGACALEEFLQEPVVIQPTVGDSSHVLWSETLTTANHSSADDVFARR
jgi:hypothetical protein